MIATDTAPGTTSVSLYRKLLIKLTLFFTFHLRRLDRREREALSSWVVRVRLCVFESVRRSVSPFVSCRTVVLQFYKRQAIPMQHAKIRPSVTLYSLDRSLPNLVWLITSAIHTQVPILGKYD